MGILDSLKKMMQGNTSGTTNSQTETITTVKTKTPMVVLAPITGTVVDLADVPDPVFSEKVVGDGLAINPTDNKIVAPFEGVITKLFHTNHAIIIKSDTGVEIMIHIGLDTVQLNGEGFTPKVKQGDHVKAGDLMLELDLNILKEKAKSLFTPILLLNEDDMGKISECAPVGAINAGDVLYKIG